MRYVNLPNDAMRRREDEVGVDDRSAAEVIASGVPKRGLPGDSSIWGGLSPDHARLHHQVEGAHVDLVESRRGTVWKERISNYGSLIFYL